MMELLGSHQLTRHEPCMSLKIEQSRASVVGRDNGKLAEIADADLPDVPAATERLLPERASVRGTAH